MLIHVVRKRRLTETSGASVESPVQLISGTAVPCLAPDVNTVASFNGVILSQRLASTRTKGHVFSIPAKGRTPKRARKASESRAFFGMMPADAASGSLDVGKSTLLQAVNTSLATKAEEEMSDFERDYPW